METFLLPSFLPSFPKASQVFIIHSTSTAAKAPKPQAAEKVHHSTEQGFLYSLRLSCLSVRPHRQFRSRILCCDLVFRSPDGMYVQKPWWYGGAQSDLRPSTRESPICKRRGGEREGSGDAAAFDAKGRSNDGRLTCAHAEDDPADARAR